MLDEFVNPKVRYLLNSAPCMLVRKDPERAYFMDAHFSLSIEETSFLAIEVCAARRTCVMLIFQHLCPLPSLPLPVLEVRRRGKDGLQEAHSPGMHDAGGTTVVCYCCCCVAVFAFRREVLAFVRFCRTL